MVERANSSQAIPDRNGGAYPYASAGQGNVPMCIKWMLCNYYAS